MRVSPVRVAPEPGYPTFEQVRDRPRVRVISLLALTTLSLGCLFSYGCKTACAEVYLSEAEALAIIQAAFAQEGVTLVPGAAEQGELGLSFLADLANGELSNGR